MTDVSMTHPTRASATVKAPARLHMGFLDLNGSLGRRFGSLGLALDELATVVSAWPDEHIHAEGPQSSRAESFAHLVLQHLIQRHPDLQKAERPLGARIVVHQAIPDHAGLGSGTQLALAVGTALARLWDLPLTPREVATLLSRGQRSGIGIGLFEQGGFVVDGGRGQLDAPPCILAQQDFPAPWRMVLILDPSFQGLHGKAEKQAFADLPVFPESSSAHLCRLALMQAMPALAERDIQAFGQAISQIQAIVGDHFAPAQGGRFASTQVAQCLEWCARHGAAGVGQSSWGPTGFALVGSETQAHTLVRAARKEFRASGLEFMVCGARNRGADIQVETRDATTAPQPMPHASAA